jgi:Fe-S oxidoreductase/nitrate reductase gamma subunit
VTTEALTPPQPIKRSSSWPRRTVDFLLHVVVQDRVLSRLYPGIMHFMIFWGMTIQVLGTIINLLQYPLFLPIELPWPTGNAYLGFELVMDIGGGMLLIGLLMAIARRVFFRPSYLVNRWDDWYTLLLLLTITLLGFFSEAARLIAAQPAWRAWSPIGNALALSLQGMGVQLAPEAQIHAFFFWAHAATGTLFVVSLPFTKLRHLLSGPLNILLRKIRPLGELETIEDLETAETLGVGKTEEFTSQALLSFEACTQCGRCEDVCPSTISGMPYSPRALIYSLHRSTHENLMGENGSQPTPLLDGFLDAETPWLCTTCGACMHVCPMFVDPVSAVIDIRRYLTLTTGEIPGSVGETLMQMERRGNPWGLPKEEHATWAKELSVRVLQPGDSTDVLLYIGCAYGYDSRNQAAGRALVTLLQKAGVDFAILGAAEGCCGETARRMGHEYIFQVMAEENIATFESVKFNRMITPCAHCFNTLKNEYPHFGAKFEVLHHTEYLAMLNEEGKLNASGALTGKRITFHDSCYIGRYNAIYDEPRQVLDVLEDVTRVEMKRHHSNAFCCGGGGGHMWMETDPNTRINQRRLQQVMEEAEAELVVTSCPYCLIMFDDAIRSKGVGEQVKVIDIAEAIAGT